MEFEITLNNYRCFADPRRLSFELSSRFTAFVGINNAGKSSLLRFFHEFQELFRVLSDGSEFCNALRLSRSFQYRDVKDQSEVFCNLNDKPLAIILRIPNKKVALEILVPRNSNSFSTTLHLPNVSPLRYRDGDNIQIAVNKDLLGPNQEHVANLSCLFDALKILSRPMYIGSFRNPVNVGSKEDYYGISIGQSFVRTWKDHKLGSNKDASRAALEVTNRISHIFGFNHFEINPSADEQDLQLVINREVYRLSEVGAGLAHFILVLANAAVRRPSLILIDEPESSLHPSLQLDFLTTLGEYSQSGVLFATHSYGLARAAAERIYTVQKEVGQGSNVRRLERTPRLPEFLGELSYSGYQDLGFDRILLVEGVTEIKTAHQFLRWHNKDHQVVVLHLGGSNLINGSREQELLEMTRISRNISVIIDSERKQPGDALEKDRAEFVKVCERLKIPCQVLERRAIENYFPDEAVKVVKGPGFRGLAAFEKLSDVQPHWGKEDNWRIAGAMRPENLKGTDLGSFFETL